MKHFKVKNGRSFYLGFLLSIALSMNFALGLEFSGLDLTDPELSQRTKTLRPAQKALVLVFLSAKCPCSAAHEEVLRSLALKYQNDGFEFLGLHSNQDESVEFAKTHFLKSRIPFSVLHDDHAQYAKRFDALKTPHVFILDAAGKILFNGGISDRRNPSEASRNYLEEGLEDIKLSRPVRTTQVRTLGCVISR